MLTVLHYIVWPADRFSRVPRAVRVGSVVYLSDASRKLI